MSIARLLAACLLTAAAGLASAIDPTDEDISYLPQNILETLVTPRYGADKAVQQKCIAAGLNEAKGERALKALTASCRTKATPRKCRELSPLPPEKNSKSPQEICANACRAEAGSGKPSGACALN